MTARPRRFTATRADSATARYPAPRRLALPAGQLRAMVLTHLQAHPELDFSPAEIANALGRPKSRGAIIKICKRLLDEGMATRTQERAQRYRATPAA